MNTKTQVRPEMLAKLRGLNWKQKKQIADTLGVTAENISQAILREGRILLDVNFIRAAAPVIGLKSLSEYVTQEIITLPYEHE